MVRRKELGTCAIGEVEAGFWLSSGGDLPGSVHFQIDWSCFFYFIFIDS